MTPRSLVTIGCPALVVPATVPARVGSVEAGAGGVGAGAGEGDAGCDVWEGVGAGVALCCGGKATMRTSTAVPGFKVGICWAVGCA
jgi:hypothetical protein